MGLSLSTWKRGIEPGRQRRLEAMADELCRQAAHIAAAEHRWLRLLAEFDQEEGWATAGARSCAAWLSFACGIKPETARERVRVARALPDLPKISESFAAGRLSYSKVRAITRVATPETEELLAIYGESATAAQLERVLRGYRSVKKADDNRDAASKIEQRYLRHWVDEHGFVHVAACLPPEDGALFVNQIERFAESGGEDQPASPAPSGMTVSAETAEAGRGDAPLRSSRFDVPDPADVRRADALRMMAETAAAHAPTACVGGETNLVVLHVARDELRSEVPADSADGGDPRPDRDPEVRVGTVIEGAGRVSAETARRLACDAKVAVLVEDAMGRPLGVGRESRQVPRWLRRALKRRDRGRCQFPGCTANRYIDAHHIEHWADGGPTDLDNLMLLCRFHHRLVHEVGYEIRGSADEGFFFVRPDGSVVSERPPVWDGDAGTLERSNDRLSITPTTSVPDWDGTRPDYSMAVGVLLDVAEGRAHSPMPRR